MPRRNNRERAIIQKEIYSGVQKAKKQVTSATRHELSGDRWAFLRNQSFLPNVKTNRPPKSVLLNGILYHWCKRCIDRGTPVTRQTALQAALAIQHRIRQVEDETTNLKESWIDKFFQDWSWTPEIRLGVSASQPVEQALSLYSGEDMYAVAETGLRWFQDLSQSVVKDKLVVSTVLCCNATFDCYPITLVGKATRPHSLQRPDLKYWTHDPKGYMTVPSVQGWLRKFYFYVGARTILLLMTDSQINRTAVGNLTTPHNITVMFTSDPFKCLEYENIVQRFKSLFQRRTLDAMVRCFDGQSPMDVVNLHIAIPWIVHAWSEAVRSDFQGNCEQLFTEALRKGNIQNPKSLEEFLNAPDDLNLETAMRWVKDWTDEEENRDTYPVR